MILDLLLTGLAIAIVFSLFYALYRVIKEVLALLRALLRRLPKLPKRKKRNLNVWNSIILPSETKEELQIIQSILCRPKTYKKRWGQDPPRGMILHGPSGTGKTLIARSLAQDAGYYFFSASTADIKHKYVGESEQRIRDLYARAKEKAPCIIFLDEIEGIGAKRSATEGDSGGGGRAQNSLTNQLLQEIDGLYSNKHIFTIGASNHLELVDTALLSRLSYRVYIGLPDAQARRELFNLYTYPYKKRLNYPLNELVTSSEGMSGRDIETICKVAAMLAHGRHKEVVSKEEFDRAFTRVEQNSVKENALLT